MGIKTTILIATILAVFFSTQPATAKPIEPEIGEKIGKPLPELPPPDDNWEDQFEMDEDEDIPIPTEPPKPPTTTPAPAPAPLTAAKGSCGNRSYPSRITVIVEYAGAKPDETVIGTVVINLPNPDSK